MMAARRELPPSKRFGVALQRPRASTAIQRDEILNPAVTAGTFSFNWLLRGSKHLEPLLQIVDIETLHQATAKSRLGSW